MFSLIAEDKQANNLTNFIWSAAILSEFLDIFLLPRRLISEQSSECFHEEEELSYLNR